MKKTIVKRKRELNDTPARWKSIYKKYRLSKEDYNKILQEQKGVCFICQRDPFSIKPRRHLSVDHDHTTGQIRGLLCYSCNHKLLGWIIKDSKEMAWRLWQYLDRKVDYGKVL